MGVAGVQQHLPLRPACQRAPPLALPPPPPPHTHTPTQVPLDGTTYDLATGKVLSWCPKDNPLRSLLGALKDRSEPVDLQVYPLQIRGAKVYVNLTTQAK